MNHFCTFYVIRTDLWDYFDCDSVFAYGAKGTYKCKEIVLTIFKINLKVHLQDKCCKELKLANGKDFRNNSVCLLGPGQIFAQGTQLWTHLNNNHTNYFYSVSPLRTMGKHSVTIKIVQ